MSLVPSTSTGGAHLLCPTVGGCFTWTAEAAAGTVDLAAAFGAAPAPAQPMAFLCSANTYLVDALAEWEHRFTSIKLAFSQSSGL